VFFFSFFFNDDDYTELFTNARRLSHVDTP